MPKPTFYRLPQEKRIALLDSAKKEFQTYLLKDASINRIIQKAGISRGGFYLYFENIEDIYFYLLDECIDNYMKHFFMLLDSNKGNIFDSIHALFDDMITFCLKEEHIQFSRNVFLNMTLFRNQELFTKETKACPFREYKALLSQKIDKTLLKIHQDSELFDILRMLFTVMVEDLLLIIVFERPLDEVKLYFQRHISYFQYGIVKRKEDEDETYSKDF